MPYCSILECKNDSRRKNLKNGGVSYHRFPKDPRFKEKWIDATGRIKWMPTKLSTICSEHFEEDIFLISNKGFRYMKPTALPTLKIVKFFNEQHNIDNVSAGCSKRQDGSRGYNLGSPPETSRIDENFKETTKVEQVEHVNDVHAHSTILNKQHNIDNVSAGCSKRQDVSRGYNLGSPSEKSRIDEDFKETIKVEQIEHVNDVHAHSTILDKQHNIDNVSAGCSKRQDVSRGYNLGSPPEKSRIDEDFKETIKVEQVEHVNDVHAHSTILDKQHNIENMSAISSKRQDGSRSYNLSSPPKKSRIDEDFNETYKVEQFEQVNPVHSHFSGRVIQLERETVKPVDASGMDSTFLSPRKRKLKGRLRFCKNKIKKQALKIKRLQTMNRELKKKINNMNGTLKNLEEMFSMAKAKLECLENIKLEV